MPKLDALQEAIREVLSQVVGGPIPTLDTLPGAVEGYGLTTFGFNHVTLNGIVTGVEYRSLEQENGFVDHLKVWVAVPALVPVVFKSSPAEAIVKNLTKPAATLGVPGITHLQRVPVIISGRAAAQHWYPLLKRGHVVWLAGQLVPMVPFEPGFRSSEIAILATQVQASTTPVKWDKSQGPVPWSKTFTDAFYDKLNQLKMKRRKALRLIVTSRTKAERKEHFKKVNREEREGKRRAIKQYFMEDEGKGPSGRSK